MPATTEATSKSARSNSAKGRCQHLRADGKRCAGTVYPGHATLCHHHLSQQMRGIADGNSIAADILSSVGNFQSASAINVALGKLVVHQITGRISRQDALALAYTFQLLLQTLKMVKSELQECGYDQWWREETSRILSGPSDLDEITNQALLPTAAQPLHPEPFVPNPAPAPAAPAAAAPPSGSAGPQPGSSSPLPSASPSAPPQTAPPTPPSQSAPTAASANSARPTPAAATPPPRPAAPTPPSPAAQTSPPRSPAP